MKSAPKKSDTKKLTNAAQHTKMRVAQAKKKSAQAVSVSRAAAASSMGLAVTGPLRTVSNGVQPKGLGLYVDPSLRLQGRPERIASQPVGAWFGGWNANVQADVNRVVSSASSTGKVATLVAYNIPARDCGQYSAGGAGSSAAYKQWISQFAAGIGARKAIVILEPDALPGLDCLSATAQKQRLSDISYAVSVLASTGAATYIDAGNYSWHSVGTMASRLKAANVSAARGFSLNVSGYGWTDRSTTYGQQLVGAIGGSKGFVIDTSRNGKGPTSTNEWCNPRGRGLGKNPTTNTGVLSLDAYLWVKVPGESDGTCNGGPAAGEWWNTIANELIRNAVR